MCGIREWSNMMSSEFKKHGASEVQKTKQKSLSEEIAESANTVITIEDLYSQLQSLKHDIEIESIQKKLSKFEQFFEAFGEDEAVLKDMISWYKQKKLKEST